MRGRQTKFWHKEKTTNPKVYGLERLVAAIILWSERLKHFVSGILNEMHVRHTRV